MELEFKADDVFFTNTTEATAKSDFIVNGVAGKYRTLSIAEWQYLFTTRTVNGGIRENKSYSLNITYGGKMGLVLYPDDYDKEPISGIVTELPEGVVFLPATGCRNGSNVVDAGTYGCYWSSSTFGEYNAYQVRFVSDNVSTGDYDYRTLGMSVRLVTDCE